MTDKRYNLFIVVDGKEHQIELTAPFTEQEAQVQMETLKKVESGWFGLADGAMIAVNSKCCNFHFIVKPIIGE